MQFLHVGLTVPELWETYVCSCSMMLYPVLVLLNGVALCHVPLKATTLPSMHSRTCPTVWRLGNAWGFMTISGTIPCCVNGRSSCLKVAPTTPFWPCMLENLSPACGARAKRKHTLAIWCPSSSVVRSTWSTRPCSCVLRRWLVSTSFALPFSAVILPITMSPFSSHSPIWGKPSCSIFCKLCLYHVRNSSDTLGLPKCSSTLCLSSPR